MSDSVVRLAHEILDVRRLALGHATSPQLINGSLDGGSIAVNDADGNNIAAIGVGDNGGFGIDYLDGPQPPRPTPPVVTADAGLLRVEWDGRWEAPTDDDAATITDDIDLVEVHASMDPNFVPDRVESFGGAYASLDGGSHVIGPLPQAGTYYVRLVGRSKAGKYSVPSDMVEQELAIAGIDEALTNAWLTGETAAIAADGKSSIWRGPEEPEVDPENPPKDGDIWFEMTEDGKSIPNIWDSDAGGWVGNDDYRQSEIERVQAELRKELDTVIVDGTGTRNFYSPTAPSPGDSREGDLWFDSSEGGKNAVSIFENGEWVGVADKRLAELAQAQEDFGGDISAAESRAVAEAKSLAEEARSAAESAAAADATSKANQAKADANKHTDTKVFGETQIAKDAITAPKIKAGAIGAVAIAAGAIESKHITTSKLLADAVLVGGSVGSTLIKDGAITTEKIAVGSITADSGIIGSINAGTITAGEMSGARIKAGTIDADRVLIKGSVGSTLIEKGAITTEKIAAGAITAESGIIGSIDANVITSGKIMANQLDADALNGKTITGAKIRTASSGSRVELTQNGLKQYNSLGAVVTDMSLGEFNVNGGTLTGATVRTSATGDRVEMNKTGVEVIRAGATRARMTGGGLEVLSGGNINVGSGGSLNIADGDLILGKGMIDGSALTEQLSGTAVNASDSDWSVPSGKVWKAINTANIPVPSWATTAYVQCTGYVKFRRYNTYGGEVPTIRLEIAGNSGDWINCPVSDGGNNWINAVGTCFHTRVVTGLGSTLRLQLFARAPINYPVNSDQRSRIGGLIMFAR